MGVALPTVDFPFSPNRAIEVDYPQPDIRYTLVGTAGGNDPDTGDIYRGLDRFGRIKDSYWYNYGTSADADRIKYGYNRAGNRTYRENPVATANSKAFDELYLNDLIHRLKSIDRGTLNGSKTGVTGKTFAQCWTLDSTGNWRGFRQDDNGDSSWDLIQARTSNTVNEITDITETAGASWVTPAYNRAGNMTTTPQSAAPTTGYACTHDAWNRLVKVVDAPTSNTVAEYAYDGARRQTVKKTYAAGVLSETRHLYYTDPSKWQVIEERVGASANAERQYVWGSRYIDDLVLRDRDTNGDGTLDERLYALQDANRNITSISSISGVIQERYIYDPYGTPTFLTAAFGSRASSSFAWETLYAGYRWEAATGLYGVRNRAYLALIGTWLQRDPLGLAAGMNVYEYMSGNPMTGVDPLGLGSIVPTFCNSIVSLVEHCANTSGPIPLCMLVTKLACNWFKCVDLVWQATDATTAEERLKQVPDCRCVKDNDSCYHCWAKCTLISKCNFPTLPVAGAGVFLELIGIFIDLPDSLYDLAADAAGIGCATGGAGCSSCCVGATSGFPIT